jgi:hypothetical protein
MQVVADGDGRCRLVWITDVLPDQAAATLGPMIDHGADVMKQTLEKR